MADLGAYDHNQSSPSTTWTITHNLGTTEVVIDTSILVGSPGELTKAQPAEMAVFDSNTVNVTWSIAQAGRARVIGGGD